MAPEIKHNTNMNVNEFAKTEYTTSPFGNVEQNAICENIFMNNPNKVQTPVSDDVVKYITNFAKQNNADLVEESIQNLGEGKFSFHLERENDECTGMEILYYTSTLNETPKLKNKALISYTNNTHVQMPECDITFKDLEDARYEAQGALNILSAVLDSSNPEEKEILSETQKKIQEKLSTFDNIFEKNIKK